MTNWPYNYHAHTPYGDGHSPSIDYVSEALERGMGAIGLSEHGPLGDDINWTLPLREMAAYRRELHELKRQHAGRLEVLCGLECDYWPTRAEWWERIEPDSWDYRIGSVHFITTESATWAIDSSAKTFEEGVRDAFHGDIRAACAAFFQAEQEAASCGRFHILAHCDLVKKFNKDHRYFDPTENWYREMALALIDTAARADIIVEVNTAGLDKPVGEYYPAPWMIERCVEKNVRITLSADAHAASEIQRHFARVLPELQQLGVKELWRLTEGKWSAVEIDRIEDGGG